MLFIIMLDFMLLFIIIIYWDINTNNITSAETTKNILLGIIRCTYLNTQWWVVGRGYKVVGVCKSMMNPFLWFSGTYTHNLNPHPWLPTHNPPQSRTISQTPQ